jgi:hypothetical protein
LQIADEEWIFRVLFMDGTSLSIKDHTGETIGTPRFRSKGNPRWRDKTR